ncbi:MAG: CoA-binding protein [Thermoplasmata archaeon]
MARYLIDQGYRVIPVNPGLSEVLGQKSYPDLGSIPANISIDIVDIFRKSEHVPPIVEEALRRGRPAIWMQLGVSHPIAASLARESGVPVFEDLCIMQQHRRLRLPRRPPQG